MGCFPPGRIGKKLGNHKMNTFFKWLTSQNKKNIPDSKREKYFNQLKTIWETSAKASIPETPDTTEEWLKLQRAIALEENKTRTVRIKPSWDNVFKPRYAFATAILLLIIVSSFFIYNLLNLEQYQTNRKEQLTIVLSDNSEVQLNCVSKLTLNKNFNKESRQVTLNGEAYFNIRKGNFPFIIKTDVATVRVVGTQFNVKSRDGQLEVAVNEGAVDVLTRSESKDSTVVLTRGLFNICKKGESPTLPQLIQFDQYPGWIHGHLSFYQTELKFVCQEIERQFDMTIILADKQLETISITGLFAASDLSNLLSALCILTQKEY